MWPTMRRGRTLRDTHMEHVARVLASPLKGVYSTHIDSAQQFGRHWHDTYGFGFLEHGAQEWFSGRGIVRGYPGEVIATNPGEVHDGRPLGPPTRRWRIAYVDVDVDPHGIRAGPRRDDQSGDQRPASRPDPAGSFCASRALEQS